MQILGIQGTPITIIELAANEKRIRLSQFFQKVRSEYFLIIFFVEEADVDLPK